jgi:hypothetical protein
MQNQGPPVQQGRQVGGMNNRRKGMEVGVLAEHVQAMSHHSRQRHVLQMGTILYQYIKADIMTSMFIIDFGGDDTFVYVAEEHCCFYMGMEPSVNGPLFSDSVDRQKLLGLYTKDSMPVDYDPDGDTELLGTGTPAIPKELRTPQAGPHSQR